MISNFDHFDDDKKKAIILLLSKISKKSDFYLSLSEISIEN